jgi:glycosyltransferase involved in cell wall biosynthesis
MEPILKKSKLLVINYSMDKDDQVFSHQIQVVMALSHRFDQVFVVTARSNPGYLPNNIKVRSTHWKQARPLSNVLNIVLAVLPIVIQNRKIVVFSHMTEVQSAILAPLTKFLRIKHYLWYAHASKSRYLTWCSYWTDGIITSTPGSCPLSGRKVHVIGQSIDPGKFQYFKHEFRFLNRFIHIGRFDPSKEIPLLIREVENLRITRPEATLSIYGEPSSSKHLDYAKGIEQQNRENLNNEWLSFSPALPRELIPFEYQKYEIFIHAFQGSLDKTLIEATMCGLAVVTSNLEYINDFGSWSGAPISLEREVSALLNLSPSEITTEVQRRHDVAVSKHSMDQWTSRLYAILSEGNL